MTPKKDLELYLHIPFCRQKCRYCDFLSAPLAADSSTADGYVPEAYVDALLSQIVQESQFYQERRVTTIFWGGGTPSLLRVMDMERLMDAIRTHFCVADDAEITLESNPGTLDFEKLVGYRRAGINRLSMGLQSACDKELAMLGRIHNFDTFVQNYKQARRAGFENINVDLMSALPGQTVESWEQTLVKTAELAPEHLSAYSLIIEEGTPFWNWYGEDANQTLRPKEMLPLPSEEDPTDWKWEGYRLFEDRAGNRIATYTSTYARYAASEIPKGPVTLVGVLQYGNAGSIGKSYMIKMRDENDCFR